jgi:hypothetical protein
MGLDRIVRSLHGVVVSAADRTSPILMLVASFLTGTALGIVARICMRFITSHREFSWVETLFIVVVAHAVLTGASVVLSWT